MVSDDSDFIALYAKVKEAANHIGAATDRDPFLWILTNREGTRSSTLRDYFPNDYVQVVPYSLIGPTTADNAESERNLEAVPSLDTESELCQEMAVAIIESLPVGQFKSTDCQQVIKRIWPDNHLSNADGPKFGIQFRKTIWQHLKNRGVVEPNPNKKPRRFEMTESAKRTIH